MYFMMHTKAKLPKRVQICTKNCKLNNQQTFSETKISLIYLNISTNFFEVISLRSINSKCPVFLEVTLCSAELVVCYEADLEFQLTGLGFRDFLISKDVLLFSLSYYNSDTY
jgi:hypothetical protein